MNSFLAILIFEFKRNWRLIFLWSILWLVMSFAIIATFDGLAENLEGLEALYKSFPREVLEAFAIDPDKPNDFPSFFNSQFFVLYLLSSSILTTWLSVNKIAKEITSKSLTFLLTKPINRASIYFAKSIAVIAELVFSNFFLIVASVFLFKVAIQSISEVPIIYFVNLFFLSFIFQTFFLGIGFLLSAWLSDSKALGIGVIIGVIAFFMNFLTAIQGVPNFLKYLNPFWYLDLLNINSEELLGFGTHLILLVIGIIALLVGNFIFLKRDIEI